MATQYKSKLTDLNRLNKANHNGYNLVVLFTIIATLGVEVILFLENTQKYVSNLPYSVAAIVFIAFFVGFSSFLIFFMIFSFVLFLVEKLFPNSRYKINIEQIPLWYELAIKSNKIKENITRDGTAESVTSENKIILRSIISDLEEYSEELDQDIFLKDESTKVKNFCEILSHLVYPNLDSNHFSALEAIFRECEEGFTLGGLPDLTHYKNQLEWKEIPPELKKKTLIELVKNLFSMYFRSNTALQLICIFIVCTFILFVTVPLFLELIWNNTNILDVYKRQQFTLKETIAQFGIIVPVLLSAIITIIYSTKQTKK